VPFKVPDVYSVGTAFRATDRFLLSAQYDLVRYSQLSRNLLDVNGDDGSEAHQAVTHDLKVPDSNQFRFGSEYAFVGGTRVTSLRIGTAYESAHQMTYTQSTPTNFTRLAVLYPPTSGQWHVTPGAGVAFEKFQVDGAVDVSSRIVTISVSAVYRF
jgi:long-subunit fatty acid transport protein